jgi:hypothetical protein
MTRIPSVTCGQGHRGSAGHRGAPSPRPAAGRRWPWRCTRTGPIRQEDSGPLAGWGWGYTGISARQNGGGFLTDQFPDACKVIWDSRGQTATSRHVPGVSSTGLIHPGLMGNAPAADLLATWNRREGALIATTRTGCVYLPTGIFDLPVEPSASGPARVDPRQGVPRSSS